jgi:membrane protein DedA with SNARE-associated domain
MNLLMQRYGRLLPPLLIIFLLILLQILSGYGLIVPPSDLLEAFSKRLGSGGLLFVATVSFFEALVIFNAYFPGSAVILFAMASTAGDWNRALLTFTAIVISSGAAHQINYWAGRLLAKLDEIRRMENKGAPTLIEAFVSYWNPHLGSLYSLRSGSNGVAYKRFLFRFVLAFGLWNIFWGVLMYKLGDVPISGSEFLLLFYIYLAWWIVQELRSVLKKSKSGPYNKS